MKTRASTPWSYSLPALSDLDNDEVNIVIYGLPSFMTFDATANKFEIAELKDLLNTVIPIGEHKLWIYLRNEGPDYRYQMTFDI